MDITALSQKQIVEELQIRYAIKTLAEKGYIIKDCNEDKSGRENIPIQYNNFKRIEECRDEYDFWVINKKIAENFIGRKISHEEYQNECCKNISGLTDEIYVLGIYEDGVTSGGNLDFLSKESLKDTIACMQQIYDNYDKYFEEFMNCQLEKFIKNCMRKTNKSKMNKKYLEKYIKENPEIDKNEVGTIYVMKNCGYYKIGKAVIGSKRFGEYTRLPEEPEYIIKEIVYSYGKVETALHTRYNAKRLRGGNCEWFDLSDDDIKKIKEFVNLYLADDE